MPNESQIKNNFKLLKTISMHLLTYSFIHSKKIFVEGQMLRLEYDTNISFCPQRVCSLE